MTNSLNTPSQQEIWKIVQDINDSWVLGRPENLENYFHNEIVFVAPGFSHRIQGRTACMDSFRDFCSKAKVHDFKPADPAIDVCGETAVATYSFRVEYDLGDESFVEGGRDVWVLARDKDRWLAVWRTIIPNETK